MHLFSTAYSWQQFIFCPYPSNSLIPPQDWHKGASAWVGEHTDNRAVSLFVFASVQDEVELELSGDNEHQMQKQSDSQNCASARQEIHLALFSLETLLGLNLRVSGTTTAETVRRLLCKGKEM